MSNIKFEYVKYNIYIYLKLLIHIRYCIACTLLLFLKVSHSLCGLDVGLSNEVPCRFVDLGMWSGISSPVLLSRRPRDSGHTLRTKCRIKQLRFSDISDTMNTRGCLDVAMCIFVDVRMCACVIPYLCTRDSMHASSICSSSSPPSSFQHYAGFY